mmetsp:Transcript_70805/g.190641  ORF Transcript_70805/g.190641 Transcript_70805/m.190641 type:complete len:84 (-) Transcript_70805:203-454(-)
MMPKSGIFRVQGVKNYPITDDAGSDDVMAANHVIAFCDAAGPPFKEYNRFSKRWEYCNVGSRGRNGCELQAKWTSTRPRQSTL